MIIVSLTMSMEERRKRVLERHSGDENSADMMDVSKNFTFKFKNEVFSILRPSWSHWRPVSRTLWR